MSLSKYEIACVTAGVPASGDNVLDQIILQSLRFRTAVEFVKLDISLHEQYRKDNNDRMAEAIIAADALIKQFQTPAK